MPRPPGGLQPLSPASSSFLTRGVSQQPSASFTGSKIKMYNTTAGFVDKTCPHYIFLIWRWAFKDLQKLANIIYDVYIHRAVSKSDSLSRFHHFTLSILNDLCCVAAFTLVGRAPLKRVRGIKMQEDCTLTWMALALALALSGTGTSGQIGCRW